MLGCAAATPTLSPSNPSLSSETSRQDSGKGSMARDRAGKLRRLGIVRLVETLVWQTRQARDIVARKRYRAVNMVDMFSS